MRQGEHKRCADDGDSQVTPKREGCLGAAVSRVRAAPLARSPASGLLFRATPQPAAPLPRLAASPAVEEERNRGREQPRRRGVAGGSEELDLD
nr:unnamed protein product [Digitaria exilis]